MNLLYLRKDSLLVEQGGDTGAALSQGFFYELTANI